LLLRVGARVARVGFDRVDCDPLYRDHRFLFRYRGQARALTGVGYGLSLIGKFRLSSCDADRIAGLRVLAAPLAVSHFGQVAALGIAEVISAAASPQPDGRMHCRASLGAVCHHLPAPSRIAHRPAWLRRSIVTFSCVRCRKIGTMRSDLLSQVLSAGS
jgi:hypothetical protein